MEPPDTKANRILKKIMACGWEVFHYESIYFQYLMSYQGSSIDFKKGAYVMNTIIEFLTFEIEKSMQKGK